MKYEVVLELKIQIFIPRSIYNFNVVLFLFSQEYLPFFQGLRCISLSPGIISLSPEIISLSLRIIYPFLWDYIIFSWVCLFRVIISSLSWDYIPSSFLVFYPLFQRIICPICMGLSPIYPGIVSPFRWDYLPFSSDYLPFPLHYLRYEEDCEDGACSLQTCVLMYLFFMLSLTEVVQKSITTVHLSTLHDTYLIT